MAFINIPFLFNLQEWEEKANKEKERYVDEMKKFKGSASASSGGDKSGSSPAKRKHDSPGTTKGGFKSKEYISDDDSSDSEKGAKKKPSKVCCWVNFKFTFIFNDIFRCFYRLKTRMINRLRIPRRAAKTMMMTATRKWKWMKTKSRKQNRRVKIAIKFRFKFYIVLAFISNHKVYIQT